MKKNIFNIILALAIIPVANAQIKSYEMGLPECILEKDSKVYVEDFKYTGTGNADAGFSASLKKNVEGNLTSDYGNDVMSKLPWAKNKLYSLATSASGATHVVSGNFTHTAGEPKTTIKTDKAIVSEGVLLGTYVHFLTFTESADVSFSGNVAVKTSSGSEVFNRNFSKNAVAQQIQQFTPPTQPLNTKTNIASLGQSIASNSSYYAMLGIRINNAEYKLQNIKIETKDKATKKEIKELEKTIKKTIKSNPSNISAVGKNCLEILNLEESNRIKYNIGVCYMAIGNYTKAKEYLDASGLGGKHNIDQKIQDRSVLAGLGVEIVENDF